MSYFNIVAETSENTVVTEYEPVKKRSDSYQSEAELEQEFIRLLCEQGYEYLYMVNNSSSRKRYASPKAGTELYLDLVFRQ